MPSEHQLKLYLHEAQAAMFLFQMIEEGLKTSIGYAHEAIRAAIPPGIAFNVPESEYENAPLKRLINLFSRITVNEPLLNQLNQLPDLRNYCAHKAFALAFLSEVRPSVDFAAEQAKVQKALNAAEDAFAALQLEMKAIEEVRKSALRAKSAG